MDKKHPVNLNLLSIKFPITAITSILHRLSGVFLFLLIPIILYIWSYSLTSSLHFANVQAWLGSWGVKILLWLLLAALIYHLVAGIRHLIMDLGYGESKTSGPRGARAVLIVSVILFVLGVILL